MYLSYMHYTVRTRVEGPACQWCRPYSATHESCPGGSLTCLGPDRCKAKQASKQVRERMVCVYVCMCLCIYVFMSLLV